MPFLGEIFDMKISREQNEYIVRSGTRTRESVRSLPKGHFQQYRQMFDQSVSSNNSSLSTTKLSTIHERSGQGCKPIPSYLLLKLPVTDDEKLQHTNNEKRQSSSTTRSPLNKTDQILHQTTSLPVETTPNSTTRGKPEMKSNERHAID